MVRTKYLPGIFQRRILNRAGNNIVSYYLGDMLSNAGITSEKTQLEIVSIQALGNVWTTEKSQNIVLNAWCLVCAMTGTFLTDHAGRKALCLFACVSMTIMLFIVGGLTKGENRSLFPFNLR